jgi:hypothetical protein
VINNNIKSNKLEDQVYWYKAEPHEPFTIGSKEFWMVHNENLANNDEEEDEEELFDFKSFKKKKGPEVNVKKTYA